MSGFDPKKELFICEDCREKFRYKVNFKRHLCEKIKRRGGYTKT